MSAELLTLLLHGNQLKRTARTGWVQRGIPNAENVAAHSYGVVFAALVLAAQVSIALDMQKVLHMAALHDLPEGLTTDIPTPAWGYLPPGIKTEVERRALQEILGDVPFAADWTAVWEELHADQSPEAHLVHDADKIDMFLQAWIYGEQTGNRHLREFWETPYTFHFPVAQQIYDQLRRRALGGLG